MARWMCLCVADGVRMHAACACRSLVADRVSASEAYQVGPVRVVPSAGMSPAGQSIAIHRLPSPPRPRQPCHLPDPSRRPPITAIIIMLRPIQRHHRLSCRPSSSQVGSSPEPPPCLSFCCECEWCECAVVAPCPHQPGTHRNRTTSPPVPHRSMYLLLHHACCCNRPFTTRTRAHGRSCSELRTRGVLPRSACESVQGSCCSVTVLSWACKIPASLSSSPPPADAPMVHLRVWPGSGPSFDTSAAVPVQIPRPATVLVMCVCVCMCVCP